jgi:hypothetical protein
VTIEMLGFVFSALSALKTKASWPQEAQEAQKRIGFL